MRYSYEFKLECIELYRQGVWPETPEGVTAKRFKNQIREWDRIAIAQGEETLKHDSFEIFSNAVDEYIRYYNNERIQRKTKWMPPVKYRIASMCSV